MKKMSNDGKTSHSQALVKYCENSHSIKKKIYTFKGISITIPTQFYTETGGKMIWNHKKKKKKKYQNHPEQ